MAYIDRNLIEGETVVYDAKPHWVLFLKPMILTVIFVAIAAALFYFAAESINSSGATLMRRIGGIDRAGHHPDCCRCIPPVSANMP
jgi:hypothetical protein